MFVLLPVEVPRFHRCYRSYKGEYCQYWQCTRYRYPEGSVLYNDTCIMRHLRSIHNQSLLYDPLYTYLSVCLSTCVRLMLPRAAHTFSRYTTGCPQTRTDSVLYNDTCIMRHLRSIHNQALLYHLYVCLPEATLK